MNVTFRIELTIFLGHLDKIQELLEFRNSKRLLFQNFVVRFFDVEIKASYEFFM